MTECPYLTKSGKKCGKKVGKNEVACEKHGGKGKNQKGGFIYDLVYPMGASVGAATYVLYKLNSIASRWYLDKHHKDTPKKLKNKKN